MLIHDFLVQPQCRLILRSKEALVLSILVEFRSENGVIGIEIAAPPARCANDPLWDTKP